MIQPKYNKKNTIFMGVDSIEINLVRTFCPTWSLKFEMTSKIVQSCRSLIYLLTGQNKSETNMMRKGNPQKMSNVGFWLNGQICSKKVLFPTN